MLKFCKRYNFKTNKNNAARNLKIPMNLIIFNNLISKQIKIPLKDQNQNYNNIKVSKIYLKVK